MADPRRRPHGIVWTTPPTPDRPARAAGARCLACRTGSCGACVRAGCYHRCPGMRSHGVTATSEGPEHGAPGPGRRV